MAANALGVSEHAMIKTLVMENQNREPLVVLMHGDREVSAKNLARHLSCKSIAPCDPETASKHTGYLTGGTSPFGTRKELTVYIEHSVFDLETVYINGGLRGFLVSMTPEELKKLKYEIVKVAYGEEWTV